MARITQQTILDRIDYYDLPNSEATAGLSVKKNPSAVVAALVFFPKMLGKYWYKSPAGENRPDVRLRNRSFIDTLVRDCVGKRVLVIAHSVIVLTLLNQLQLAADLVVILVGCQGAVFNIIFPVNLHVLFFAPFFNKRPYPRSWSPSPVYGISTSTWDLTTRPESG